MYCKWHTDRRRWVIRRVNGDLTYFSYSNMHSLPQFGINYFRRIVGRGAYEENLEEWFKHFLSREWKDDYPNFTLNKGRSYLHPTEVDPGTCKRRKAWRYKMPEDHGEPIYHGEPFTPNMLYDFVALEFDNRTGEVAIHCGTMHTLHFFDKHEMAGLDKEDGFVETLQFSLIHDEICSEGQHRQNS